MARKKRFAPNDNNLAIAYYRFSSHSQNDASIEQQRELAHEWADAHGFKIVQEYEDAAISGTTDARPGFQQMLSEVAKIRPHTLIMWKTYRLGRDKYVLAMAKKKIRDAGCEIHLLAENIPAEGPEGVLIEGLMEAMAEYYSRQLSQNIQRGMDYNAAWTTTRSTPCTTATSCSATTWTGPRRSTSLTRTQRRSCSGRSGNTHRASR